MKINILKTEISFYSNRKKIYNMNRFLYIYIKFIEPTNRRIVLEPKGVYPRLGDSSTSEQLVQWRA